MNQLVNKLDSLLSDLVVDESFFKSIKEFNYTWAYKNEEHMRFLGGATIGEQVVTFSNRDDDVFYSLLNTTYDDVRQTIHSISAIDKSRQVSSNPHYILLMYLIHKTYETKKLNKDKIEELVLELYSTFAYRVISGRMHHYFKYPLDPDIAKTVTERLSNKFILKKMGNWNKLIEYRAKDILPNGLHYKAMLSLDIDKIQRAIADLYTRLKDIFKNIYPIIIEVKNSEDMIQSTSLIEIDKAGETVFSDNVIHADAYVTYLKGIINKPTDLVNDALVRLVTKAIGAVSPDELKKALYGLNQLDLDMLNSIVEHLIPDILDFLYRKGITSGYEKNILKIIQLVKGYAVAHTVKSEPILMCRDIFSDYINLVFEDNIRRDFMYNCIGAMITYLAIRPIYK